MEAEFYGKELMTCMNCLTSESRRECLMGLGRWNPGGQEGHNVYYVKSPIPASMSAEKSRGLSGCRVSCRFSPIWRAKASSRRSFAGLLADVPVRYFGARPKARKARS